MYAYTWSHTTPSSTVGSGEAGAGASSMVSVKRGMSRDVIAKPEVHVLPASTGAAIMLEREGDANT